ncbi:hypothetical protein BJX68DRAFT_90801 [Aspergillus pseudodeflectus]|uniref:NADH:flavin oxidoreductase/NADH oxidase N-terminal domain-containing protein n=1 Tax=Aspergillus pseudodeflectus TaxID=176178 RepID=A0ABR4KGE7_9EURO
MSRLSYRCWVSNSLYFVLDKLSVPGTLLITEGTFITARAGGSNNVPGIWSNAQIKQWKTITDVVHARGSYIFCQLWALGRAANPEVLVKSGYDVISSGNLAISEKMAIPRPLSEEDVSSSIQDYATAAADASKAGFDGVEIHGANGYLCDQFLQDTCYNRVDQWGGSVKNRSRFGLEVARAVVAAGGAHRTAYRISPWSTFQGMKMEDLQSQFTHLVQNLGSLNLAYLHIVDPRISGSTTVEADHEDHDFLLDAYGNKGSDGSAHVVIMAGGFTAESAEQTIKDYKSHRVAVASGRHFLANPDLPFGIFNGVDLNKYNRPTFYTPKEPVGYIDYPFSDEFAQAQA